MQEKLSDSEVGDRLHAAEKSLECKGQTEWANTALQAARKALHLIRMALVAAGVKAGD